MTRIRRLEAVGAALALAAALTCASVWGDIGGLPKNQRLQDADQSARKSSDSAIDALAASKFRKSAVVTYTTADGEKLFALQAKPAIPPAAARPVDYLVMVDTSASQVGRPLASARALVQTLVAKARPEDRLSLWTVNTPKATHDLTHGFKAPHSEDIVRATKALVDEVPMGDTDLKGGLNRAVKNAFGSENDRQRAIVFLGDGMSTHSPISQDERVRLCKDMVENQIAFFSVPLGPRFDPKNLHGFASGTGGRVVRVEAKQSPVEVVDRLQKAVAAPILYPTQFHFDGGVVTEFFPAKMPPLRSDVPTLITGRFKGAATLSFTVSGTVAGKAVEVKGTAPVSAPEADNFFLVTMLDQWKNAPEQPALMQADRALVLADQLDHVHLAELLAEGEILVAQNNFDGAGKVFEKAKALDPQDTEAAAGLKLVELLRDHKVTKEQILGRDGDGVLFKKGADGKQQVVRGKLKDLVARLDRDAEQPPPGGAEALPPARPGVPPANPNTLIEQQRLRMEVARQRARQVVDDAIRQARRLDPDDARDLLKNVMAGIGDDPDLRDTRAQALMLGELQSTIRGVEQRAVVFHRNREEQLQLLALAEQRVQAAANQSALEERTRERMRVFHGLMNQARYLDAYRQALAIQQDAINQGNPVPVAATAAYDTGLVSSNLRELQELRRRREERYLLTMMQVERSAVPFPDEPPVEFPPAASWRELTRLRKEKYESSGLLAEDEQTVQKVKRLRDLVNRPISINFPANTTIADAVQFIEDKYNVTILIDTNAWKQDPDLNEKYPEGVDRQPVHLPQLNDISMATVLRLLFAPVSGTYIIRRDYIEITTAKVQAREKVIRAYPVADLVTPIPNGFSSTGVGQNQQVFGQTVTVGGVAGGGLLGAQGLGGIGGLGGLGALGGGLGALGALGGGLGALGGGLGALGGGLGALGGGLGALGGVGGALGGALGGGLGVGGGLGMQGGQGQNFGVGGGFLGIGGGQMGQFGNFGGQFGIQGGDTHILLERLIIRVVGTPSDWMPPPVLPGTLRLGPNANGGDENGGGDDTDSPYAKPNEANTLDYYPTARALIVKGTSRINASLTGGMLNPAAPGAAAGGGAGDNARGALNRPDDGTQLARLAHKRNRGDQVAGAAGARPGDEVRKRIQATRPSQAVTDLDARKIWNDALAGSGADPGIIIATADFLVEHKKFDHAAEFLKAALRQGLVSDPWVFQALSVALKESHASDEDVERAELSVVDLQPQNVSGYLQASAAMADQKRWDRAVAFCQQAAQLEPNAPTPYEKALGYAATAADVPAMEWAAGNLLAHDWPVNNEKLHQQALEKLHALAEQVREGSQGKLAQLQRAEGKAQERDLVIVLGWQGEADLDLEVREPIGTACSFQQHQSAGGGTLIGDSVSDPTHETYVAAKAFPGRYEIKVHRVWGRPLGSKATLHIIEHQGTPQQKDRWETVVFDRDGSLSVDLDIGRRKSPAQVAPEGLLRALRHSDSKLPTTASVLRKLRNMSDPKETAAPVDMESGFGSMSLPASSPLPQAAVPASQTTVPAALIQSLIDHSGTALDNPIIPGGRS